MTVPQDVPKNTENLIQEAENSLKKNEFFLSALRRELLEELSIKIDLNKRRVDVLLSNSELKKRRSKRKIKPLTNQTPWQELSRLTVGQLEDGACIRTRSMYTNIVEKKGTPRHSH